MTMLPDVDETSYDDWQRQQAAQEMDQKIQSFGLEHAMNSRIAELSQFQAPTSSDSLTNPRGTGNALPSPPEPAPPESTEAPSTPVQEPPALPATPAPPLPQPPTPAPQPQSPNSLQDWVGAALGAVRQSGGDIQKFADGLDL